MTYKKETKKKAGKPKMSEEEKKARQLLLKTENIESRTKRVINPRLKALFKNFDMLISSVNSPRYKFTENQATAIITEVENRTIALKNSFSGKGEKKEVADIL